MTGELTEFRWAKALREAKSPAESAGVLVALGDALQERGHLGAAVAVLDRARELHPTHPSVHVVMAKTYRRADLLPEARRAWERARELDPANAVARRALEEFEAAAVASPPPARRLPPPVDDEEDGVPTRTLAELYREQGFLRKAIETYQRMLRVGGDPSLAERLAELQGDLAGLRVAVGEEA